MFTASTLAFCGNGVQAEDFARRSAAAHEALGAQASREEWAHARLVLAYSLLNRADPVIDEAATVAATAVDIVERYRTHTVLQRVRDLVVRLRDHRRVPAVAALYERTAAVTPSAPAKGVR
jgi:hypothetical protein